MTTTNRVEMNNTLKNITLTITTPAIGFGTCQIFIALSQFPNIPVRGNIYQIYRVSIAILEAKVEIVQRSVRSISDHVEDFAETRPDAQFVITAKSVVTLADPLASVINAVGVRKVNDTIYIPKFERTNRTRELQRFIPQSEQVTFSNLFLFWR